MCSSRETQYLSIRSRLGKWPSNPINVNTAQLSSNQKGSGVVIKGNTCRSEESRRLGAVSQVANLIEFITCVIHRQAFNVNRDMRTDTKKTREWVYMVRLYLQGRGAKARRETLC